MKYLAIGDCHLDERNRLEDLKKILDQIVGIADDREVDKILFLGDLFTSRRPSALEYNVAYNWAVKLVNKKDGTKRQVVLMAGNHDEQKDATTLDAFDILKVDGIKVVRSGHVEDKIFMGHFILQEAIMGTSDIHVEGTITVEQLVTRYPGHLLYLFGDVHTPQQVSKNPPIYYIGSVMRNNFGEKNNEPRVLVFNDDLKIESVPLNDRKMLQYSLQFQNGILDSLQPIRKEIIEESIVKAVVSVEESEYYLVDEQKIRDMFFGAMSLLIHYDVKKIGPIRDTKVTEDTPDDGALEEYLIKKGLTGKELSDTMTEGRAIILSTSK